MSQIHVFATLTAATEHADALRGHLEHLVAESSKEPGVLDYHVYEDLKTPGSFHVFETYQDQAAVDAHMASTHFREAAAKFGPLLAGRPSIVTTKRVA